MGWGELAACLYKTTILVLFSKRVSTSMILTNVLYYTRNIGGGGGPIYARMCVSKSEGHGSLFGFKRVK